MNDWELIRDGIDSAVNSIGEPISLTIGTNEYDLTAVVTAVSNLTESGSSLRVQRDEIQCRFIRPENVMMPQYGNKITYRNLEWVITSVSSGVYDQVRVSAARMTSLEGGKKIRGFD